MRAVVLLPVLAGLGLGCSGVTGLFGPLVVTREGPCDGHRTEVLLVEEGGVAWAGCGTDVGLFRSANVLVAPFRSVEGFERYHVYDVARGADGRLLVAGGEEGKDARLVAWDGSRRETLLRYSGKRPFMRIANGENVAVASSGRMMVDSTTGTQLGYFDGTEWVEAEYWNEGVLDGKEKGYQLLDLVAEGDAFYGVGSISSEPPVVFVPSRKDGASYHLRPVVLAPGARGALEGIWSLGADHLVAVGVDEETDRGMLYTCSGECGDGQSWKTHDARDLGVPESGKLFDVAFDPSGTHGIAIGQHVPQSRGGYAIVTHDGGVTWKHAGGTFPILTAAAALGDGNFVVAGGDGYLGVGKF